MTAKQLRDELAGVFSELKQGKADIRRATELANIAGKMIQSAKAQLEHARLREEKPDIDFLK